MANQTLWDSANASRTLTFGLSGANDPVLTLSDGVINVSTGSLQVGGTAVSLSGHSHAASDITSGTLGITRGGTGVTSATNNAVLVGDNSGFNLTVIPSCSNGTTDKLLYNTTTRQFSCGSDQTGAGGSGITSLNGLSGTTQTFSKTNDTNVTLTITSSGSDHAFALGWTGTLAAGRLNSNVVQAITNDTNVTGSISAQTLTLGWTGTLAKARQHANTVYNDQANTFGAFVQTFQGGANHLIVDPTDTTKKFQFDVSNVATATTRTVNIPNANSTTVQSNAGSANNFVTAISAQGVVSIAQPSFSNLSGTATAGQLPSTAVNSVVNDTNVTGSISAQALTLGWTGTLAKARQNSATVYNDAGNTFSTGAQDFGSATSLKVPTGAGAAPTANGLLAYDSTANAYKFGVNGATKTVLMADGSGANLTSLNASQLSSGTVPYARMPLNVKGSCACDGTTDDASALQTLVNTMVTGDTLTFEGCKTIKLGSQITFGNGSGSFNTNTSATASTVNDISVEGHNVTVTWTGSSGGPFKAAGPMSRLRVRDISVNMNGNAGIAFDFYHTRLSEFRQLHVQTNADWGLRLRAYQRWDPGDGANGNTFQGIWISSTTAGAKGITIGDTNTCDACSMHLDPAQNHFTNIRARFDTGVGTWLASSIGLQLNFTDASQCDDCIFSAATALQVVVPSGSVGASYPAGWQFNSVSLQGTSSFSVSGSWTAVEKFGFNNYLTGDSQVIPSDVTNTYGVDSNGNQFGFGARTAGIVTKSSAYTLTSSDATVLANAVSGGFTIGLPSAASAVKGRLYTIKKTDSTSNSVVIDPSGSETIDGATTINLGGQNDAVTIQSDGTNWQRVSKSDQATSAGYISGLQVEYVSGSSVKVNTGAAQMADTAQTLTLTSSSTISPTRYSTLNGGITNSQTSITVFSTSLYPSTGTIKIDSEQITYTSKNSTQFLGCTRGANSTSAASHSSGANVTFAGWFYLYAYDSGGITIECNTTAPDVPWIGTARYKTGDPSRRYIGAVKTDINSNFYRFFHNPQTGFYQWQEVTTVTPFRVVTNGQQTTEATANCSEVVPITSRFIQLRMINTETVQNVFIRGSSGGANALRLLS